MEKKVYEKPEFDFNELYLFDGIANTCWGYGHVNIRVYGDTNKNNQLDDGEPVYFDKQYYVGENGHCNEVANQVRNDLANTPDEYDQYLVQVSGSENSKSLPDTPYQDFHS